MTLPHMTHTCLYRTIEAAIETTVDVSPMMVATHSTIFNSTILSLSAQRPQCGKQVPLIKMKSTWQVMFCTVTDLDMLPVSMQSIARPTDDRLFLT